MGKPQPTFKPTQAMQAAARRAERMLEAGTKAGTATGRARMRQLIRGDLLTLRDVQEMAAWFARHDKTRPEDGAGTEAKPTPWLVAWEMRGGDAGRETVTRWREQHAEAIEALMGDAVAPSAFADADDGTTVPPGVELHNPLGLHVGRPLRIFTAGTQMRSRFSGKPRGQRLTVEAFEEMIRVARLRRAHGDGNPRIDVAHQGSPLVADGTGVTYGQSLAEFIHDDGLRGPGLYMVPGYSDEGRAYVHKHRVTREDGSRSSTLYTSPEFVIGRPVYMREGDDDTPMGTAELFAVALVGRQQQPDSLIDPVVFADDPEAVEALACGGSKHNDRGPRAALEESMKDKDKPAEVEARADEMAPEEGVIEEAVDTEASEEQPSDEGRLDAMEAQLKNLAEQFEKLAARMAPEADSEAPGAMAPEAMADTPDGEEEAPAAVQALAEFGLEAADEAGAVQALCEALRAERKARADIEVQAYADKRAAAIEAVIARGFPVAMREQMERDYDLEHQPVTVGGRVVEVKAWSERWADAEPVIPTGRKGHSGAEPASTPDAEPSEPHAWAEWAKGKGYVQSFSEGLKVFERKFNQSAVVTGGAKHEEV